MKKTSILILVGFAIVLGAAGILFELSQSASWNRAKTDRRVLPDLAVNEVSKIRMQSSKATLTLEKKDQIWCVAERNDYPAEFQKIRHLTQTLWELKAVQAMQVGPSQFARLKILGPGEGVDSGTEIKLMGNQEKAFGTLIIGKSMDQGEQTGPGGRFVFNPATKDRVYLVSERLSEVDPLIVGLWLDETFIQPGALKEIIQSAWPNNPGWRLSRENETTPWKLDGATADEKLDPAFEGSLGTFTPSIQDVAPESTPSDLTGFRDPFRVELKTFDGFDYVFVLGKQGPDKTRYLQVKVSADIALTRTPDPGETPDDKRKKDEAFDQKAVILKSRLVKEKAFEKWIYLVSDSTVESLLKRRDEIIAKPAPAPSPETNK
jgi:hypothetical protein